MAKLNLGELYASLRLDSSGFSKGVADAKANLTGLGSALAAIGPQLAIAGAAFTAFAMKAINMASDVEENLNVLNVSFGENTKAVQQWATAFGQSAGRSDRQMSMFAGRMGAMLGGMLDDSGAVKEISTRLSGLAVDLGSFFNAADDEALLALRSALAGEAEPMKRFGVVMTEAAQNAWLLEQGLHVTTQALSEQEKVLVRYAFIMDATQQAQGDAERTADSYANQVKRLQGEIDNLTTSLGTTLLPAATSIVGKLNEMAGAAAFAAKAVGELKDAGISLPKQLIGTALETAASVVDMQGATAVSGVLRSMSSSLGAPKSAEARALEAFKASSPGDAARADEMFRLKSDLLGLEAPSDRELRGPAGTNLLAGIGKGGGAKEFAKALQKAMQDPIDGVASWMKGLRASGFWQDTGGIEAFAKVGAGSPVDAALEDFTARMEKLSKVVEDTTPLFNSMEDATRGFISNVIGPLGSAFEDLLIWVGAISTNRGVSNQELALSSIGGFLSQSKAGQDLMRTVSIGMQGLADGFGELLRPLLPLVSIVAMLAKSLGELVGSLSGFLMPAAMALFEGIKYVAAVINVIAKTLEWTIDTAVGGILNVAATILAKINEYADWAIPDDWIASLRAMAPETKPFGEMVEEAWDAFADLKFEDLTSGLDDATAAVNSFSESFRNVPAGFKMAAALYANTGADVADVSPSARAAANAEPGAAAAGGGGGRTSITQNVTGNSFWLSVDNPRALWDALRRINDAEALATSGAPVSGSHATDPTGHGAYTP